MKLHTTKVLSRMNHDNRGTSAIEFAIVAPIFLVLVFAIVVYGAYFASLGLVNHIAYEAARATVAGLSDTERASLAQARAQELITGFSGFLNADAISVTSGVKSTGVYEVTVRYQFDEVGLSGLSLLPLPPSSETATYSISDGGY